MKTKKLQEIIKTLSDGLVSIYLYQKGADSIPVFIVKQIDFVFLDAIRYLFKYEKFIILTQDDILEGKDVFCLKLLHIKNHAELFYGRDVLSTISYHPADMRSLLELEIRNKRIQLREDYLASSSGKEFLKHILLGMEVLWEGGLYTKNPSIKFPKDMKELLSLFDVAWSCNSQIFYYLIDGKVEDEKIPSLIQDIHEYLSGLCTKVNNFTS